MARSPLDCMVGRVRVIALVLALAFGAGGVACTRDEPSPIPGVRLGMSPRDVRDRFEGGDAGAWQTRVGTGDDTVLEWTAKAPSPLASARFEFHMGMLVAVRARQEAEGPPAEQATVTPKTVTVKARAPEGGTSVTVLARDCPTHRDEAEALVKRAGSGRSGP